MHLVKTTMVTKKQILESLNRERLWIFLHQRSKLRYWRKRLTRCWFKNVRLAFVLVLNLHFIFEILNPVVFVAEQMADLHRRLGLPLIWRKIWFQLFLIFSWVNGINGLRMLYTSASFSRCVVEDGATLGHCQALVVVVLTSLDINYVSGDFVAQAILIVLLEDFALLFILARCCWSWGPLGQDAFLNVYHFEIT